MNAGSLVHNTGEMLLFLCIAGMVSVLFRWRQASRRDFLVAFAVVLAGLAMRESVIWRFGVTGWPENALLLSGAARVVTLAGAVLFVRAALRDACGEWGWIVVTAAAGLAALIV